MRIRSIEKAASPSCRPVERSCLPLLVGPLVLASIMTLAGCASPPPRTTAEFEKQQELIDSTWVLQTIQPPGGTPVFPNDAGRYLLQFKTDGRLGVVADCNSCVGTYRSNRPALIMQVECLRQECGPGSRGDLFMDFLNQIRTYSMKGDKLYLYTINHDGVLSLVRSPNPLPSDSLGREPE
jgi:heat shock protein HslJ